jgi:hypothetical protein
MLIDINSSPGFKKCPTFMVGHFFLAKITHDPKPLPHNPIANNTCFDK